MERRDAGRWIAEGMERQELAGAPMPPEAKQASEIRARWAWTEPAVWTDRMLSALEESVKGGVWFSLISDGQTATLRNLGCILWNTPEQTPDGHFDVTTDWRAVCGRTARTVRREGRPVNRPSLPLSY